MIQKKIHRGIFAVMDGTFAGDGPGPRCMVPHVKNVMLASADQVAIDAVAAKLMGFDPMSIKYIRMAHDLGLGCGDPRDIEIVGDADAAKENWNFVGPVQEDDVRGAACSTTSIGGRCANRSSGRSRRCWRRGPTSPASSITTASGIRSTPSGTSSWCWTARGDGCSRTGNASPPTTTGSPRRRRAGRDHARRHARLQTVTGHPRHLHQGSAGVCQPPSAHQSRTRREVTR